MSGFRTSEIKNDKVRLFLMEAERKGLELAERTVGHKNVDAHTVLIIGLAFMLADSNCCISPKDNQP